MKRSFDLIQCSGADASEFLQGQLTQDLRELASAGALLAAWCNPKGRVIGVMRLLDLGDGIGLAVPPDLADVIVSRLTTYRLRARVEISIADDWRAGAVAAAPDLALLDASGLLPAQQALAARRARGLTALELGGPARCVELYGSAADFERAALDPADPLSDADWQRALIEAGIPNITAASSEQYTPHMLNLDRLGAVSFHKGCYAGQEVVARTEHRGSVKRRLAHYRLAGGGAATGDRLLHDTRDAGAVVNAAAGHLLAVVPVELHDRPLTVNGHTASPAPLPYAL